MGDKLVSIIIPCFNQSQFLVEAMRSVLNQTYDDWECIIVNDGSEDNTEDIANRWVKKDKRFKYIKQENKGLSAARNLGVLESLGHFILPLDADDLIEPDYIKLALQAVKKDSNLKVVYCRAKYFGAKSGVWNLPKYTFYGLLESNKIFCTALYRKKDWQAVGGYDSEMKYGFEDWEFWIHILKNGGTVKRLEYFGFYYRVKEKSMLSSMTQEHIEYSRNYVLNKHKDVYLKSFSDLIQENKAQENLLRSRKNALKLLSKNLFRFKF